MNNSRIHGFEGTRIPWIMSIKGILFNLLKLDIYIHKYRYTYLMYIIIHKSIIKLSLLLHEKQMNLKYFCHKVGSPMGAWMLSVIAPLPKYLQIDIWYFSNEIHAPLCLFLVSHNALVDMRLLIFSQELQALWRCIIYVSN